MVQDEKPRGPHWNPLGVCRIRIAPTISRAHLLSHNHLRSPNRSPRPNTHDMDIRNQFSRLKKKVKRLGNKQKPGRPGGDTDGESVGPGNLLPQPEPHVVANDGEGSGADEGGHQAGPTDQPPQLDEPELLLANGGENDQGAGEADIDGRKAGSMHLHLPSDAEVWAGSGPCQGGDEDDAEEDGQFYSRSSSPSVQHSGDPNGVLTSQFNFLHQSFIQTM